MDLAAALKLLARASREQLVVPRTGDVSDDNDGSSPPPCIVLPKHVARRNPSYCQQRHEMEGRSQPQQRRSRVARLVTEQRSKPSSRRTGHRQRGSAFQQQADVDPPKEEYPTLPAERRFDDMGCHAAAVNQPLGCVRPRGLAAVSGVRSRDGTELVGDVPHEFVALRDCHFQSRIDRRPDAY